jgi:HSP20 family protein
MEFNVSQKGGLIVVINFPRVLDSSMDFQKSLEKILSADLNVPVSLNAVSMWKEGEEIKVAAEIPGAKKEAINLEIKNDVLRIHGERKHARWGNGEGVKFDTSLRLPVAVDSERAKATYEDGILYLSLPLAERAKAKKILVD